jgi:hypothetical protein
MAGSNASSVVVFDGDLCQEPLPFANCQITIQYPSVGKTIVHS